MKKNVVLIIACGLIAILAVVYLFYSSPSTTPTLPNSIVLFFQEGCIHCKNVDDFIARNSIQNKVQFEKSDIRIPENQPLLLQVAKQCGIKETEIGTPLLWDGSKCLTGDTDIINFFSSKVGISK
jgi:hypothetical protein